MELVEGIVTVGDAVEQSSTSSPSQTHENADEQSSSSPGSSSTPQDAAGAHSGEPSVADAPEDTVEHGSTSPPSQTHQDVDGFVERLGAIGDEHGVAVQAFDARYVVDRVHLERAVALADRAFARDDAIARDRSVEILLYAAGRRQIERALTMGVGEGATPVVVVVHSPDENGDERAGAAAVADLLDPAETLGEYDPERVRDFFEVSERELAATSGTLADLVRERVALLTVEK